MITKRTMLWALIAKHTMLRSHLACVTLHHVGSPTIQTTLFGRYVPDMRNQAVDAWDGSAAVHSAHIRRGRIVRTIVLLRGPFCHPLQYESCCGDQLQRGRCCVPTVPSPSLESSPQHHPCCMLWSLPPQHHLCCSR